MCCVRTMTRRRWRPLALVAACLVLAGAISAVYASRTPSLYGATTRVSVVSGGPDSAYLPTAPSIATLDDYAAAIRGPIVAEAAVRRLPMPPPNKPALLRAAAQADHQLNVTVDPAARTIAITVKATTAAQAALLANAFATGFLQLRGAQAVNRAQARFAAIGKQLASLPPNAPSRAASLRRLSSELKRTIDENQVAIVTDPPSSHDPALVTGIALSAALLVALVLVLLIGRRGPNDPMPATQVRPTGQQTEPSQLVGAGRH